NFFPFYLSYAASRHVDMAGVEVLDEQNIPLLIDRFPYDQRFQSFQLYQRAVRWKTLENALKHRFHRAPKQLFDEWQTGFTVLNTVNDQTEIELLEKLQDPQIRYLDFFSGDFDHVAHLTSDPVTQFHAIAALDALVGRVWNGIEQGPLADTTALVLISDHGMNTQEGVFSQGYNLVDWFNSAAGGALHVITDRHPMDEFKLKGLDPLVSAVVTPSRESMYLAGQTQYPAAMLELDGNEKAGVGLRNNTLNVLQILLDQLMHKHLAGNVRAAALNAFFEVLDRVREPWQRDLDDLKSELAALQTRIDEQQKYLNTLPKKWSQEQRELGLDKNARRAASHIENWRQEKSGYERYISTIGRLLALQPSDFDPGKFKMEDLIPIRSFGPLNSIYDLQNYAAGPATDGLALAEDGSLDFGRSFRRVNYFRALEAISVRNNVQKDVDSKPVDFIAAVVPEAALAAALPPEDRPDRDGIWLWGDEEHQALILSRKSAGEQELRYIPVAHFAEDAKGAVHFERVDWSAGFPLRIYEDPQFQVPAAQRTEWLNAWHGERAWFEAVHRTKYSNGIIGLTEEMLTQPGPADAGPLGQYKARESRLRRTDFMIFARDHWNFNARGFNPGGNHGSFLRVSTNSVFMIAGGKDTGIPRGLRVEAPYDSLSFVATILKLMDKPDPSLPGPVIKELLPVH
ncbi:MAG TPA: alkaline phosphatase family protein, partial [Bryobacteraceae bacterium]|nr:alkaline phosphatase family protein [Bryobacteraceae bacterium]